MEHVNFIQEGNGHCFHCHRETEPHDNHFVKKHLNDGSKTTPCTEACGEWFNKLNNMHTDKELSIKDILIALTDKTGFDHSSEALEAFVQAEDSLKELLSLQKQKIIEVIKQDIQSVLSMLDGETDRKKIANYIREYLIKEIQ